MKSHKKKIFSLQGVNSWLWIQTWIPIRIRIEEKCWIRIRIETYADPIHWFSNPGLQDCNLPKCLMIYWSLFLNLLRRIWSLKSEEFEILRFQDINRNASTTRPHFTVGPVCRYLPTQVGTVTDSCQKDRKITYSRKQIKKYNKA